MDEAAVYASDPASPPDTDFIPGELRHLVPGNRGRLLDPRRTPIAVVDVSSERAAFVVRIEAFEDSGAEWELGLDEVGHFQFVRFGSFMSATFSRVVAESHFEGGPSTRAAVLWRQPLPLDRLFMTFLETRAMNERYREAEAVLIGDPVSRAF